mgnify:CR=1 FL=1
MVLGSIVPKLNHPKIFYLTKNGMDVGAVGLKLQLKKLPVVSAIRGGSTLHGDESTADTFTVNDAAKSVDEPKKRKFFWLDVMYPLLRSALSTIITDSDVLDVLTHILSIVTWMYILLSVLGTWGIDTKPVLSLLGIGGLTVGFSAQSLLADSYAGLVLLFIRPFQRGDVITVNGLKGKVLSVDMRYVRLYSVAEKCEILIPVSTVYKSDIKIDRSLPQ